MYTTQSSYFDNAEKNPDIWANWIAQWNPGDAQEIAQSYWRNCQVIGINPELCIAQASLETAHFTSYHYTHEHNMAGVGITGDATTGVDFGSIEGGVKGHLAHLCAYIFSADNDPQPSLADNDPQWRDIRGDTSGHNPFHDGIHFIHTLEQPDVNNEGVHRWAASGWNYVPNIITVANSVVGTPVPVQPVPTPPPVVFPTQDPSIIKNDTNVNVWNAGEWGGRSQYPVRAIVLHVMAGSYAGSINWFHNPAAQASANYCVSYGGEITETVDPDTEAPYANGISNGNNTSLPPGLADLQWGHPNANFVTVSIETEGGSPDESGYPRQQEYQSVIRLMAFLCKKYNLKPSTDTIVRHTNFDTVNRPHCPGEHWDFNKIIDDVTIAMNIPHPVDPNDPHGIVSADGKYRTWNFIPGTPVLGGRIKEYWEKAGNLNGNVDMDKAIWVLGYPMTSEMTITRDNNTPITSVVCERAILEWHPENQGTENEVLESRIGEMMLLYLNRLSVLANGALYHDVLQGDARVNQPIDARFKDYYDKWNGLRHWGYAITESFQDPQDPSLTIQYTERGCLELHPDGNVYGRRLGADYLEALKNPLHGNDGIEVIPVVMA